MRGQAVGSPGIYPQLLLVRWLPSTAEVSSQKPIGGAWAGEGLGFRVEGVGVRVLSFGPSDGPMSLKKCCQTHLVLD